MSVPFITQGNQRKIIYRAAYTLFLIIAFLFPVLWSSTNAHAAIPPKLTPEDPDFPICPGAKPNINFWIKIFTQYSKYEGVLHDTDDLSIVYGTVKLFNNDTRSGRKKNKQIKKKATKRIETILLSLAKGIPAKTDREKQIKALFGKNTAPSIFRRAAKRIRIQTGLKEEFKGSLVRSGAFIETFKKIFKSHGLPEDLVYLPHVESSYRYKAYSKFGAAGIWQFTRSTGRLYMDIGYVVDERRDPFIATDAAARLLKKNFAELKEWPLAITAYNHGLNGMRRAVSQKGSYENILKSYRSRSFKFASRNFYSEFIAARHVATHYEKYFGPIDFNPPMVFHTIKTKGYLPAETLARSLKIDTATLAHFNPALRKPVFNGQKYIPKGYRLKLPKDLNLNHISSLMTSLYKSKQKPSRFHRVQKGDTAGRIARIHKVSLNDLILANGLNRRATIYVGQNLRIPTKGEGLTAATRVAVIKPAVKKPEHVEQADIILPKVLVPNTVLAKKSSSKPAVEIAADTEPQAIEGKNDTPVNPLIVTGDLKITSIKTSAGRHTGIIRVQPEETLGHYADWLGIKTQAIRNLNRFRYGTPISIDQAVKIPLMDVDAQVADFEEKRYEYHKEIEEDFFNSFSIQGTDTYVIKKGDNIWSLCLNELEVPFWLLKKYNPQINFQTLMPQTRILYPIIEEKDTDETLPPH